MQLNILNIFLILSFLFASANASYGDVSAPFVQCMSKCYSKNCTDEEIFQKSQSWVLWLTRWSCKDECSYECMWVTEEHFRQHGYDVKFYGKWPFIRVLGMQEVVSVVASILNLASHVYCLRAIRKKIPHSSPMSKLWISLTLCAINAWFWSAVFHARDTPYTEKLDYFCALSLVMLSFYIFLVRITHEHKRVHVGLAILAVCYYILHCSYMMFVKFDYGLNMKVNVAIGISNSAGWILFWLKDRKRLPHLHKAAVCIVITMALMSLEVWDFPPFLYLVDAHSLWHLGTCPIALLMLSFIIDDCKFLYKQELDAQKIK